MIAVETEIEWSAGSHPVGQWVTLERGTCQMCLDINVSDPRCAAAIMVAFAGGTPGCGSVSVLNQTWSTTIYYLSFWSLSPIVCNTVIILSSLHTAMKTKCKVDYYFLNCNMLSTHKQLSRVGNTFLLVGKEASELWKRQIGVSGVY